jgi:ferredoxin-NADP reductase
MQEFLATIVAAGPLSPAVKRFVLAPIDDTSTAHAPGQHVALVLASGAGERVRYYSIASAPRKDGRFELCIATDLDSGAARALTKLSTGDRIRVRGPGGSFLLREPVERDVLLIGSGTGIAPLRAMLQRLVQLQTERPVTLLQGARTADDLLFHAEWERLPAQLAGFTYCPTLTEPAATWSERRGRVQAHVEELLADRTDVDVYLCGHPQMVTSVGQTLARLGIAPDHVHCEKHG